MVAFCTAVQKASIPFNYSLFTLNYSLFRGARKFAAENVFRERGVVIYD